jgi:alpha-tubulin suppressor-like RCC1 family protein
MAHTVAASRDGAVYAWGWGSDGQLGLAEPTASAAVSIAGTCGVTSSGGGGDVSSVSSNVKQQLQPRSSLLPELVEYEELDQEDVVQVGEML